jgi:chemotaxis methyl-accepting protein methylase
MTARLQVLADLDSDAINIARSGVYRLSIAQDLSPERLQILGKHADSYLVNKNIREMITLPSITSSVTAFSDWT